MQTLLAYAVFDELSRDDVLARLSRIEQHYAAVNITPIEAAGIAGKRLGLIIWDHEGAPSTWPAWTANEVRGAATLYAPLGWQRIVRNLPPDKCPVPLAEALVRDPSLIRHLTPPYVLATIDSSASQVDLFTDGLGYGRLYEWTSDFGIIWSNRLGALSIFAGEAPAASSNGWNLMAGAGWFMADSTAMANVKTVGPSAHLRCTLRGTEVLVERTSTGALEEWLTGGNDLADQVADDLAVNAASVGQLWNMPTAVHLSGGRDSRAVAAGAVAAGIDLHFLTKATLQGELDVAERLVALLPVTYEHRTFVEVDSSASGNLRTRIDALMLAYDGMYAPAGVKQTKFGGFSARRSATLSGAGGEIARGYYYRKPGKKEEIETRGRAAALDAISTIYRAQRGVPDSVHEEVDQVIEDVLSEAAGIGLSQLAATDYFYLIERARRWSTANTKHGLMAPLITPAFIRAAFSMSPEERVGDVLHLGVISRLVPQWADVSFYKGSPADAKSSPRPFLWASGDRADFEAILAEPTTWEDSFDPAKVRAIWELACSGKGVGGHEMLFHRVIWRWGFEHHLATLSKAANALPVGGNHARVQYAGPLA